MLKLVSDTTRLIHIDTKKKTIIAMFIINNLCCLTLPSRDFSFILGTSTAIRFVWKLK